MTISSLRFVYGAGDRSRTGVSTLEGWHNSRYTTPALLNLIVRDSNIAFDGVGESRGITIIRYPRRIFSVLTP